MSYSRDHPSPRYRELQAMYLDMHCHGERFLGIPAEETCPAPKPAAGAFWRLA